MRDTRGFTLLEVVVAVGVLGIGVAVAMQVFSGGLKNLHRVELAHRAMSHAENVMNELLSDEAIRGPYQTGGDLDDDFHYNAFVAYWEDPQASLGDALVESRIDLLSVTVEIHYRNDANGRLYRTVSMKTVSEEPFDGQGGAISTAERLFGRRNR